VIREAEVVGGGGVFVLGFSQGCALAYHSTLGMTLGAVVGVAGFTMIDYDWEQAPAPRFLFYGNKDKVRPFETVKKVWGWLKED
jgi:predicted esterase